jgi:hypothetical protein
MYEDIDLTNPNLGSELLRDPKGNLPLDVWEKCCLEHNRHSPEPLVLAWRTNPRDLAPIDPRIAVRHASRLLRHTIAHLTSNCPEEALKTAKQAWEILVRTPPEFSRKRGQPSTMRLPAIRAYIIRKFNPHPAVKWDKVVDMLFLKDGKCPRKIREEQETRICGVSKHG